MLRYLSQSRFKLALACPRNSNYSGKSEDVYTTLKDGFLAPLAKSGFQVGELANLHFPVGIEITARQQPEQIRQTAKLLQPQEGGLVRGHSVGRLLARPRRASKSSEV